jgi:hypothetical protein
MATVRTLPAARTADGLSLIIAKPLTRQERAAAGGGFVPLRSTQCPPVARRRIRWQRLLLRLQGQRTRD